MILDHFGLDQLALPFDLQGHPGSCAQRPDITYFSRMMPLDFMPRQRHFMRAEQHVVTFAQVQAVGVTEEVVNEIAGRVFVDVTR
ncbi:hypothetical protein D3C81_2189040 [compost metagenome]